MRYALQRKQVYYEEMKHEKVILQFHVTKH